MTPYPFCVAFDVDGTLVGLDDVPRPKVIALLKAFKDLGAKVIVWSGEGKTYAEMWVRKLDLEVYVDECRAKPDPKDCTDVDLAVDDQLTDYGKIQLKV